MLSLRFCKTSLWLILGQVPALLDGDTIIIESLDIADYLDEKYPTETPLYPTDPVAKQKDKDVIRNLIGEATSTFSKVTYSSDSFTPEKAIEVLIPSLQPLEDELTKRGTPFFGGSQPGMVISVWSRKSSFKINRIF